MKQTINISFRGLTVLTKQVTHNKEHKKREAKGMSNGAFKPAAPPSHASRWMLFVEVEHVKTSVIKEV